MEVAQLIQWLEERYPVLPLDRELSPFEQGLLVGTYNLLKDIKSKVGVLTEDKEVIK